MQTKPSSVSPGGQPGPDNLDKTMMGWMEEWEQGIASRLFKMAVDSLSLYKMSFFFSFRLKTQCNIFCLVHWKTKP